MIVSCSGVLCFGVIGFVLFRRCGLKASHALVSCMFGFYLAGSTIAPTIQAGGQSLAGLLGGLKF